MYVHVSIAHVIGDPPVKWTPASDPLDVGSGAAPGVAGNTQGLRPTALHQLAQHIFIGLTPVLRCWRIAVSLPISAERMCEHMHGHQAPGEDGGLAGSDMGRKEPDPPHDLQPPPPPRGLQR